MVTGKTVFVGIAAVLALYIGMWLVKSFSEVSSTRTTGLDTLLPSLVSLLVNPAFWVSAVLVFGAVLLTNKLLAA